MIYQLFCRWLQWNYTRVPSRSLVDGCLQLCNCSTMWSHDAYCSLCTHQSESGLQLMYSQHVLMQCSSLKAQRK